MIPYEFPNEKCAVKGCTKKRRHLVIMTGTALNLCGTHKAEFESEGKPLTLRPFTLESVMRIIDD